MAGIEQAEAWTSALRAEQSALDLGAELGPADPTAYTMRRPIPEPRQVDRHGPARIIALANQKGGVGKTTTTIILGAALAEYGRRVLLVDFDPQGALSVGLGVNPHDLDISIYNLLMDPDVGIRDILIKTDLDGLHLLPANIDLSAAEIQLVNEVGRSVMPQLAQLWGVPYSPAQLRVVQPGTRLEDAQGNLVGIPASTDLVLLYAMPSVTMTEKFSVGGAFAAGFTMGTNTKNVAADTFVTLNAYKRDAAGGGYKKVWTGVCTGMAMHSKAQYPFPEVMRSREKAKEIFDAAVPTTVESCSQALQAHAKS